MDSENNELDQKVGKKRKLEEMEEENELSPPKSEFSPPKKRIKLDEKKEILDIETTETEVRNVGFDPNRNVSVRKVLNFDDEVDVERVEIDSEPVLPDEEDEDDDQIVRRSSLDEEEIIDDTEFENPKNTSSSNSTRWKSVSRDSRILSKNQDTPPLQASTKFLSRKSGARIFRESPAITPSKKYDDDNEEDDNEYREGDEDYEYENQNSVLFFSPSKRKKKRKLRKKGMSKRSFFLAILFFLFLIIMSIFLIFLIYHFLTERSKLGLPEEVMESQEENIEAEDIALDFEEIYNQQEFGSSQETENIFRDTSEGDL